MFLQVRDLVSVIIKELGYVRKGGCYFVARKAEVFPNAEDEFRFKVVQRQVFPYGQAGHVHKVAVLFHAEPVIEFFPVTGIKMLLGTFNEREGRGK